MKTAEFDLEKALAGHPLVTRDGRRVTKLEWLDDGVHSHPLRVTTGFGPVRLSRSGRYHMPGIDSPHDLFRLLDDDAPAASQQNVIDHPPHYVAGRRYEPIDVIEDWELTFRLGNCVKYIARAGRKGDALEDLKKAAWYLQREIQHEETKP